MADPSEPPRRQIDSPEEAFRLMEADLRAGDAIAAIVIGDHMVRLGAANAEKVLGLYTGAVAGGLEHGKLHQRIWEMEKAAGRHAPYRSAAGQDRFVEEALFRGRTGGVFVDIGGYDGVTGSNTFYFEDTLGWTGLCVEASPTQFVKMARARAAECVNAAVSDFEGTAAFLEITSGFDQMSTLTDSMRPNFQAEFEAMRRTTPSETREITVPVTTFAALARERGLGRVDFVSVDVEGAELRVLRGIDFEATDIAALSVENPPGDAETFDAVRTLMAGAGYRLIGARGDDDVFAKG